MLRAWIVRVGDVRRQTARNWKGYLDFRECRITLAFGAKRLGAARFSIQGEASLKDIHRFVHIALYTSIHSHARGIWG
jgi:hypothetical protein